MNAIYQSRRDALARQLQPDSIAMIPAAQSVCRNSDTHYRFRQDSDFYYLTGFNEPDAVLFIASHGESILFNRPHDPIAEQWTGKRVGDDAIRVVGVNQAFSIDALDTQLPLLLANKQAIYCDIGRYPSWEARLMHAWQVVKKQGRRGVDAPHSFCDLEPIVSELRLIKDAHEIHCMEQAAAATIAGHQRAMRACQRATNEYQLESELLYGFTQAGCRNIAYDSIVAFGDNACILHYSDNNQPMTAGNLVLIDAGAEYDYYAADVTRTFPLNGRFTTAQRAIYTIVFHAQQAGIACIKPGCSWDSIQTVMVREITQGLLALGLLQGTLDALIEAEAYKPFYMHSSGHWLGLDVHDCGHYKRDGRWRLLEAGMVLTVEPGIYIREGMPDVDVAYHGIGVRIEDDILVTETGYRNLTAALVSSPDDIEAFICGS